MDFPAIYMFPGCHTIAARGTHFPHLCRKLTTFLLPPLVHNTTNPHYSQIPYLQIHLLTKIDLYPQINTRGTLVTIHRHAQGGKKFEAPKAHLPANIKQGEALPSHCSSYCEHVLFTVSLVPWFLHFRALLMLSLFKTAPQT